MWKSMPIGGVYNLDELENRALRPESLYFFHGHRGSPDGIKGE